VKQVVDVEPEVVEDNCEEPKIEIIDDGRDNEPEVETK
jgi:hypothetical protein